MNVRAFSRGERRVGILLVGGHEVLRLGLRSLLETSRWFEVVADVGTVAEAIVAANVHHPALVLMAGTLTDATYVDGCNQLRARVPDARLVILSEQIEMATAMASRVGAVGCVSRQLGAQSLCRALRELGAGERPPMGGAGALFLSRRDGPRDVLALTTQERRVLQLVAHGKTNKEIGTALGLSAKTVKNYLSNAFEKLNVSRRAQAAVLFIKGYGAVGPRTRRSI